MFDNLDDRGRHHAFPRSIADLDPGQDVAAADPRQVRTETRDILQKPILDQVAIQVLKVRNDGKSLNRDEIPGFQIEVRIDVKARGVLE